MDNICGGRHESQLEECKEEIKSKEITYFEYNGREYNVSAKKENNIILITSHGGGKYSKRDGSLFGLKYEIEQDDILKELQKVIEKNHETKGNGYCVHVDGLPGGIGDLLHVEYASGEKIYKTSNQSTTISEESEKEFYDIFLKYAKKEGYDFTTEGSNIKLFDDADLDYVQGTWKGKHFGNEIEVTFQNNKVTIKVDNKITDKNVLFIIKDGFIRKNELKEEKEKADSEYDYKEFNGVSCFAKKNYFTMTAYFMQNSYSTCDLMNFDKEKPKEE